MKVLSFPRGQWLLLLAFLSTTAPLLSACQDDTAAMMMPPADPAAEERVIQQYLADNKLTGAQRQPSGLYYVPVTTNPSAAQAKAGQTVDVLYTGRLLNGTVFDATSNRGNQPFSFRLGQGQVIQGWDEGIALMRKGEKSILLIPSALGYGARGAGNGAIPPNAVLRFDVELVDVR